MYRPSFVTPEDRAKAEQLMQPALIRVIDNIRKQLDKADWQGAYEEDLVWPEGTTKAQQQRYAELQKGLHGVPPEEHDRVATQMSALPQPSPLYTLRLTKAGQSDQTLDVWQICYRVCADRSVVNEDHTITDAIAVDESLFDEGGDVDWLSLDEKAKSLIASIFQSLPT